MKEIVQSKEAVKKAFEALLREQKALKSRIVTKEETAKVEADKVLVETVGEYTTDSIVKGSAGLQLDFTLSTEQLAEKLQKELTKLEELRGALGVEQHNLKAAIDTKIAADALHILKQEQEQQSTQFEEAKMLQLKTLETEITEKRQGWEKRNAEYTAVVIERKALLEKQRTKELEQFKYQLDRTYLVDKDDYDQQKKLLLRHLEEAQAQKEKDWTKRKKLLTDNQEDFKKYKEEVDNFDTKKDEETKKAKDKAIKEANRKAKVELELLEKDVEGKDKIAALQIGELEKNIEAYQVRITGLSTELKEALAQVQALSIKALENSSKAK